MHSRFYKTMTRKFYQGYKDRLQAIISELGEIEMAVAENVYHTQGQLAQISLDAWEIGQGLQEYSLEPWRNHILDASFHVHKALETLNRLEGHHVSIRERRGLPT